MAADSARLDLEVAREQLSVNLAQMQEGRRSLRQAEEARVAETGSEGVRPYSDRSTIRQ